MKARFLLPTTALVFAVLLPSPGFAASSTPADAVDAKVTSVVDGDTIKVKLGAKTETIRIIGIDTPETKDPRKPVQCFGKEATKQTTKLLRGKTVTLETNPAENKDKYGRLLRYVAVNGNDIGAKLIQDGYAFSYKSFPHPRLESYNELEKAAREKSKGLWKACPISGNTSSASRNSTARQSSSSTGQCAIKGNVSAIGERIYHLPGCSSYEKTQIDTAAGEKWFCSEQEAKTAGWRKAANC